MKRKVLLLGDNDLACLAIARSLYKSGIEVHLVGFYDYKITTSSRCISRVYNFGHPARNTTTFVNNILNHLSANNYDMAIPALDAALNPLMNVRDEISKYTVFAAPEQYGYEITHDKAKTIEAARTLDIPIPATVTVDANTDIDKLELPTEFPLILKPSHKGKVYLVKSYEQLIGRLIVMLDKSSVLIQEFCRGYGVGVYVLSNKGKIQAAFQGRRLHEPPSGGASSYRQSEPLESELLQIADDMCSYMNYTGVAMFEYKRDSVTSSTKLMEINGRFWGSLALSIYAGVDFPKLLYEMLITGKKVNVFKYKTPVYARNTRRDFFWLLANIRTAKKDTDLLKVPLFCLFLESKNVLLLREKWDVESITDPLPALYSWLELIREIFRRLSGKIRRKRYALMSRRIVKKMKKSMFLVQLKKAKSILFVCTGNINRSAFACQYTLSRLKGKLLNVKSCGIIKENNRPCSSLAIKYGKLYNVDLSSHRSKAITESMVSSTDIIFVMDKKQIEAMHRYYPKAINKTYLLGALEKSGVSVELPDPYGCEPKVYEETFSRIANSIDKFLSLRFSSHVEIGP